MSAEDWDEANVRQSYQSQDRQAELRTKECEIRIKAGINVDYNKTEFDEALAAHMLRA